MFFIVVFSFKIEVYFFENGVEFICVWGVVVCLFLFGVGVEWSFFGVFNVEYGFVCVDKLREGFVVVEFGVFFVDGKLYLW